MYGDPSKIGRINLTGRQTPETMEYNEYSKQPFAGWFLWPPDWQAFWHHPCYVKFFYECMHAHLCARHLASDAGPDRNAKTIVI